MKRIAFVGLVVVGVVAAVLPAFGSEYAAAIGHKGYGRCHMDGCSFFIIDSATPVGQGKDGTLFKIEERTWGAEYKDDGVHDEYSRPPVSVSQKEHVTSMVYCSKTRPTVFYPGDKAGTWISNRLRPGDPGAIFGFNESSYMWYFAACHDAIVHDANPKNHLAARLGYYFPPSDGDTTSDGDSQDLQPFSMLR